MFPLKFRALMSREICRQNDACTGTQVGYELPAALAQIASSTGILSDDAQSAIRAVTAALILHPIACGVSFFAFLIAACSDRLGFICASLIAVLAAILALIAMILDLILVIFVRHWFEDNNLDGLVDVDYSYGTWTCVSSPFLSGVVTVFPWVSSGSVHVLTRLTRLQHRSRLRLPVRRRLRDALCLHPRSPPAQVQVLSARPQILCTTTAHIPFSLPVFRSRTLAEFRPLAHPNLASRIKLFCPPAVHAQTLSSLIYRFT